MDVLEWYHGVRTLVLDLIGDYCGKELFLIEGDSLLLECFSDERIDFEDGFQLLHAVYVVERFLENLVKRNCNFHIAFFEDHRLQCIPARSPSVYHSRYLLARAAIIRHLTIQLPKSYPLIELRCFDSYRSLEFTNYLGSAGMYFVMCHDGSSAEATLTRKDLDKKSEQIEILKLADEQRKRQFRSFIAWLMRYGFNVALVNEVEWRDSKVFARIVEWDYRQLSAPDMNGLSDREDFIRPVEPSSMNGKLQNGSALSSAISSIDLNEKSTLPERELFTASAIVKIIGKGSIQESLLSAFVLHVALLKELPLSKRRLVTVSIEESDQEKFDILVDNFAKAATSMIHRSAAQDNQGSSGTNVVDLVDGRLLKMVLHSINEGLEESSLPDSVLETFRIISENIDSTCGTKLVLGDRHSIRTRAPLPELNKVKANPEKLSVLPFSNFVFDEHLASIKLEIDSSTPRSDRSISSVISKEITHWHNAKRPLDPKKALAAKPVFSRRWNPLRSNQKLMSEMIQYSASLTNASGAILKPETITLGGSYTVTKAPVTSKEKPSKKPAKEPKLSKAQKIIADNTAKKQDADSSKILAAWAVKRKEFDRLEPEKRYLQAKAYLAGLDSTKVTLLRADIELYGLQGLVAWWAIYCKENDKPAGYKVAAIIWDTIRRVSSAQDGITKTVAAHLKRICTVMGLLEPRIVLAQDDKPLTFKFQYPESDDGSLSIGMPQHQFLLQYCGPYMERSTDARPDKRVPAFHPDAWQRKVLDELDANKSVFVVAPTSAGKTFISFYAMEQVLRSDDDSVLVYVAPTKALVNQIAAEILGRFNKKYQYGGQSVWAIHTRDYRINNPTGCQILVTVPHILQIMLLAPSNANSWARRVKRIIFDEIHSIGQAEDGVVWEQLLLLAPCQIIALSATVGNPQQFNDWLTSTQKAAGYDITMIQYQQRYSDLRKFMFTPPKRFAFKGLQTRKTQTESLGLDGCQGFTFFHPVACLVNKSRGMPDDLTLEARDCFTLWKSMVKHQTQKYSVPLKLDPATALPPTIGKFHIFAWEKELKAILAFWMQHSDSPFDDVLEDLSKPLEEIQPGGSRVSVKSTDSVSEEDFEEIDPNSLSSTTLPMLVELHDRNALPAILFNYSRFECENVGRTVLEKLIAAEHQWKETSSEWKKQVAGWEAWKKAKEKSSQAASKMAKKPKKSKDDDDPSSKSDAMRDAAGNEASFYDGFDPSEPLEGFTFANSRKYTASELKEDFWQLNRRGVHPWLQSALSRGIGVHHAGMNRKYRQIVEMLFRKGFLRVVIATGTLALGINMPCSTVVFSGDSTYLTALNFRQASGRAGRRGFDLLGNVVFQGIAMNKTCRLLSSRLPDLNGHFPITTTLVLRLFSLLHGSKNSQYATEAVRSLLSQPRLYLGGDSFKQQVLHHLRFSIEYLRKQNLLGARGEPINFAGCVSHLYFTENSSFAFHALLRDGYFHSLCSDIITKPEEVKLTLMIVMANIFGRRPCSLAHKENMAEIIKRSSSVVYLPPLPPKAAAVLVQHNKETLETFEAYVKTFAIQHKKEPEQELPLTGVKVGGENTGIASNILHPLQTTIARSPFVALSGHGDEFDSISDLCDTTRSGIFLEQTVIPYLELPNKDQPLNAYLYDFYRHGSLTPLEAANGIPRSNVWFMLNDFSLVLATIVTSLANFMHLSADENLDWTLTTGSGDKNELDQDEQLAAEDEGPSTANTNTKTVPPPTVSSKKKKVADDWDNENDDDDDDNTDGSQTGDDGESDMKGANGSMFEGFENDKLTLLNVFKAFQSLKAEFDEKFRAIGA